MTGDRYLPGGMTDRDLDGPDDRDCDGPVPEKYQVRVFDRSGTYEMNDSAETESFEKALLHVAKLAAKYPHQDYVVTLQNEKHVDEGKDGLTDGERDRFDEAVELGRRLRIEAKAAASGKRDLEADPEIKDIDARIRALEAMRGSLTNADRPRWSVINDIEREVRALMGALQRAAGRRK